MCGPETPLAEQGVRLLSGWCPALLEGEPKMRGPNGREVALRQAAQRRVLRRSEVLRMLEPGISTALPLGIARLFLPPHLIDRLVDHFHEMERVEGDLGRGELRMAYAMRSTCT